MATITSWRGETAHEAVAADILGARVIAEPAGITLTGILFFSIAMGLSAWIEIPLPFTPVPITLQTFFVALAAATMGGQRGSVSQILYLVAGIAGAPIFAGGAFGLARIAGPTGGYLLGFLVAPLLVGALASRAKSYRGMLAAILAGSVVILGLGMLRLTFLFNGDIGKAFLLGVLPFIPGDLLKSAAAAAIAWKWRARFQELFPL